MYMCINSSCVSGLTLLHTPFLTGPCLPLGNPAPFFGGSSATSGHIYICMYIYIYIYIGINP